MLNSLRKQQNGNFVQRISSKIGLKVDFTLTRNGKDVHIT